MTTETMNIHRALAELKVLDKRIEKEIRTASFCTAAKAFEKKVFGVPIEEYKAASKSSLDKITDMINRYNAIKQAISRSNAETHVTIAGVDYTVAEAIYMNQSGIERKHALLSVLSQQYSSSVDVANTNNAKLGDKADDFAVSAISSKEKTTSNSDEIKAMRDIYVKQNTYEIVDGINIKSVIDALSDEIDKFTAEVDSALSSSNAMTQITIVY